MYVVAPSAITWARTVAEPWAVITITGRRGKARRRAAFREAFATEAAGWQRHQAAAEYLAHLRKSLEAAPQLPELSVEWLAHAEKAVADLDPTAGRLQLLHEGVKPDWYGPFGAKLVEDKRPPGAYG